MKPQVISSLKKAGVNLSEKEIQGIIEIPPSIEMGDFAFPCFILAKELRKNPNQIAEELAKKVKSKEFEKIESKGPYINFFINRIALAENLIKEIKKQGDKFGSTNFGKGEKALIEHTSINPNASPHVGRVRNALIGDSITKILKFVGYKPEVHYYVNDVSKQIAMLVLAKAENKKFEDLLREYVKISEKVSKSEKLEKQVFELLYKFEQGDKEITKKFKKIVDTAVKGQEKILSQLGIHYDFFDYESFYQKDNQKILEQLRKTGKVSKDDDQRLILDQSGTSVEKQMKAPILVLTRSNGTGLYILRDISYTLDKLSKAKKNLIVLGEDQKLYFQQLCETLKLLKKDCPEVVHYSFILLTEKGESKKMSTRKGDVVLLEDFLNEAIAKAKKEIDKRKTKGDPRIVGVGAVKYSILKNSNNKIIHFNLDDALSFEGDTGPYLQYSYARASSILRKAKQKKFDGFKISKMEKPELELVKKLSEFPEIVLKTYNSLNPSIIAHYSYELAQLFNEFYHSCPVMNSEKQNFRLELVNSFRQVLKNSLSLLGIDVLKKM